MSERSQAVPKPEGEYFESSRFAGLSFLLGLIAVVALALCAVGAFLNPHQFSYSWLFAFAFFFTLCAGCFFWTIVHHATDADWSVVVRRQLENIAALLVVLAILFVPVLLLRHHLYAWMDIPPGVEASLDEKRAYLNWYFFLGRAVLFLGFFILAALALRRDRISPRVFQLKMIRIGPLGRGGNGGRDPAAEIEVTGWSHASDANQQAAAIGVCTHRHAGSFERGGPAFSGRRQLKLRPDCERPQAC